MAVNGPEQREGSPSQSRGQDQALEMANLDPVKAYQQLLARPSQPLDQPFHRLDRLDTTIAYKAVHTFDTMLDGDAIVRRESTSELSQGRLGQLRGCTDQFTERLALGQA